MQVDNLRMCFIVLFFAILENCLFFALLDINLLGIFLIANTTKTDTFHCLYNLALYMKLNSLLKVAYSHNLHILSSIHKKKNMLSWFWSQHENIFLRLNHAFT